jgi:DNA polymerase-1
MPADAGPLTVIDGTALLFRAFFGGARGLDAGGVEVGAVRAVAARLRRWLAPGRAVVVVFDAGPTTFRTALDPSYTAHRGEPPAELVPQFARVVDAVEALGVATWQAPGFEADDLMATLAAAAGAAGRDAILVAVDKDLCQLVGDGPPRVILEDPWSGAHTDAAGVQARLGVPPERVTDFLALVGDPTDGVRGVAGIGARTAAALLGDGTALDVYLADPARALPRAPRGGPALVARLAAAGPRVQAARALVELRRDVPLPPGLWARSAWWGAPAHAHATRAALGISAPEVKPEG